MSEPENTEEWRAVVGYEGMYEVSNFGRVKSIARVVQLTGTDRRYNKKSLRCRILSQKKKKNGYMEVTLSASGKSSVRTVHRLVLEAFVGPCPDGMECRHFPDRDKANNRSSNLSWATRIENDRDKDRHGTRSRGEHRWNAKLTTDEVVKIRDLRSTGRYSMSELAVMFDVSKKSILNVVHGRNWRHVA